MPATESLKIELPQEMAAILREAVNSGEFTSQNEIIGEALIEWKLGRSGHTAGDLAHLRQLWQQALDAGKNATYLDLDQVFDPLLKKYQ